MTGYPDLVVRYGISGVPKTVLADGIDFVGAGSEARLLEHVERAAGRVNGAGAA